MPPDAESHGVLSCEWVVLTAPSLSEVGQAQEGALMSINALQPTVGGRPEMKRRPRLPTAADGERSADRSGKRRGAMSRP